MIIKIERALSRGPHSPHHLRFHISDLVIRLCAVASRPLISLPRDLQIVPTLLILHFDSSLQTLHQLHLLLLEVLDFPQSLSYTIFQRFLTILILIG